MRKDGKIMMPVKVWYDKRGLVSEIVDIDVSEFKDQPNDLKIAIRRMFSKGELGLFMGDKVIEPVGFAPYVEPVGRGFEVVCDEMRKFPNQKIMLPQRSTSKAMAYDFFSNDIYRVNPGETVKIWTDVKVYMNDDEGLILNVRSSMGGRFALANTQGWIDSDYYSNPANDGNVGVFLTNVSNEFQIIYPGDKIAQGMFVKYLVAANGNTDTVRSGGFGSTGK